MDPAHTAVNTRVDKLPSVLDFAFTRAVVDVVAGTCRHGRTGEAVPRRCAVRRRRGGRAQAADIHRQPRCGPLPDARAEDVRAQAPRRRAAEARHARPCDAADAARRADDLLLATSRASSAKAATRNRGRTCSRARSRATMRTGCSARRATTAQANFDPDHPLYREIAELARIRTSHRALTRGLPADSLRVRTSRACSPSRGSIRRTGREMLLLFNTSTRADPAERARGNPFDAVRDAGRHLPCDRRRRREASRRFAAARLCGLQCSLRK